MKTETKILVGLVFTSFSQFALADPFDYRTWANREGKGFEARLDHIVNSETLVIQAQNGGKRYTLKKAQLSTESTDYLDKQIEQTKKALMESVKIDGELIYKGIALGLRDETEAAAVGKTLSLEVTGIRVSSDKLTATLCLESYIFANLRLSVNSEFYTSGNSLYFRSKEIGHDRSYWWYYHTGSASATGGSTSAGVDPHFGLPRRGVYRNGRFYPTTAEGILVVTKGDRWKFKFSKDVSMKWGLVGVTEGPIITDR